MYQRQLACAYDVAHALPPDDDPPAPDEELDDDEPDDDPEDDPEDEELDEDDDPEDEPEDEPDDCAASHGATHCPVDVSHAHSLGQASPHGPARTLPKFPDCSAETSAAGRPLAAIEQWAVAMASMLDSLQT